MFYYNDLFCRYPSWKGGFWEFEDIEDPMEDDIDVPEEIQAPENSNFDEEIACMILLTSLMSSRKC